MPIIVWYDAGCLAHIDTEIELHRNNQIYLDTTLSIHEHFDF